MTDEFKIYMSEPAIRKEIPYGVEWNVGMVEDRITGNLYPIHYAHDAKRFFGAGAGCRKSMREDLPSYIYIDDRVFLMSENAPKNFAFIIIMLLYHLIYDEEMPSSKEEAGNIRRTMTALGRIDPQTLAGDRYAASAVGIDTAIETMKYMAMTRERRADGLDFFDDMETELRINALKALKRKQQKETKE